MKNRKSEPSVSIIILNYNGFEDSRECLKSVLKTKYTSFKIYVADNSSANDEIGRLQKEFKDKRLTFLPLKKNYGFTGGNNKAMENIKSDYVVLLNNDTRVEANWLKELVKVAQSDPLVAVCQAKLKSMTNPKYFDYAGACGGYIDNLGYPFTRGRIFETIEEDRGQYDRESNIFWACGAAMLIKREVLEKTGGLFDDIYFIYMEEIDFCWRVWKMGYRVVFAPKAVVYHKVAASQQKILPQKRSREHRNNLILLYKNSSLVNFLGLACKRLPLELLNYLFYFAKGQLAFALALAKAHIDFVLGVKNIKKIANPIDLKQLVGSGIVYEHSIVIDYYLWGKKHFDQLKMIKKQATSKVSWQALSVFIVAGLVVTGVWFWNKQPISVGEESYTIFNNISISNQISYWQEGGAGYLAPHFSTRLNPILFYSGMKLFHIPAFAAQAMMMAAIIVLGMLAVFALTNHFFQNTTASLIAGLFYFLNIFSMSQIWSRFLYSGMFLWMSVPLLLYLWIKWLETGQKKYLGLFGLISLCFNNALLQPAHIPTLLFPLGLFFIFQLLVNTNKLSLITKASIAILIWFIANVWWIYPYLKLSGEAFSEIASFKANFDSLVSVSQYFPISEILLLRQKFLLSANPLWSKFYAQPQIIGLSILTLVISLVGWWSSRKNKYWLFLSTFSILALMMVKGANAPLGLSFYNFLFKHFSFMMALRNPYEKFGLNWLIPYSIFLGIGLGKLKSRFGKFGSLALIFGLGVILYLVWPLWKGTIYVNKKASIPEEYFQVNSWLEAQHDDLRLFQIPPSPGDSVAYTWGYGGIEPSEFIFDKSAISKVNRFVHYDDKYKLLVSDFYNQKNITSSLQQLNVGYIILHHDIDPTIKWSDAASAAALLKVSYKAEPVFSTGNLEVFKIASQSGLFKVEPSANANIAYEKINNRHYRIQLRKITLPAKLIFEETFSKSWEARAGSTPLTGHSIVYDYANSWDVNQAGDEVVDIVFKIWPWE